MNTAIETFNFIDSVNCDSTNVQNTNKYFQHRWRTWALNKRITTAIENILFIVRVNYNWKNVWNTNKDTQHQEKTWAPNTHSDRTNNVYMENLGSE